MEWTLVGGGGEWIIRAAESLLEESSQHSRTWTTEWVVGNFRLWKPHVRFSSVALTNLLITIGTFTIAEGKGAVPSATALQISIYLLAFQLILYLAFLRSIPVHCIEIFHWMTCKTSKNDEREKKASPTIPTIIALLACAIAAKEKRIVENSITSYCGAVKIGELNRLREKIAVTHWMNAMTNRR